MKPNRCLLIVSLCVAGIFPSFVGVSPAQLLSEPVRPDSVVAVVADMQGLPLVSRKDVPWFGTFWVVRNSVVLAREQKAMLSIIAPAPCPPLNESYPIYAIGERQFLVDETDGPLVLLGNRDATLTRADYAAIIQQQVDDLLNHIAWIQETELRAALSALDGQTMPLAGEENGALTSLSALLELDVGYRLEGEEYGTNLWIQITDMSSNEVSVTLHNTLIDETYEIQATTNLVTGPWTSESPLILATSDQMPATVLIGDRTNQLFLRARSWIDSDGSGMPDWWQLEWFGQTGIDPYGDPDQDGWANIQEYQNGTSPQGFNTPPAPQGVAARFTSPTTAVVSWLPSKGNILGYEIAKQGPGGSGTITIPAPQVSLEQTGLLPDHDVMSYYYSYLVRALYAHGSSEWSEEVSLRRIPDSSWYTLVRGPDSKLWIVRTGTQPEEAGVRITRYGSGSPPAIAHFEVPITSFTNGVCPLPQECTGAFGVNYRLWMQTRFNDGSCSQALEVRSQTTYPFYDGREALKQNLIFQLRAANLDNDLSFFYYWEDEFRSWPAYAYSGFWNMTLKLDEPEGVAYGEEMLNAFSLNYLLRNFVFSFEDVWGTGYLDTGIEFDSEKELPELTQPKYELLLPQSQTAPPTLLSPAQSEWIFPRRRHFDTSESYGLVKRTNRWVLDENARNLYGLPVTGIKSVWSNSPLDQETTGPGAALPSMGQRYIRTAQPQLETVDYYFAPKFRYHPWDFGPVPIPGAPSFSVANTTPLLVAALGDDSYQLGGWAKQRIVNGYEDKFGYLGQYFDKAYKVDSIGQVTANETGILSPYGEFMPLEPGPTALVTMPDLDTGERGTAVVHVVSLALDRNHDGVMELAFTGEDQTTSYRPFRFWANNDHDEPASGSNPDRDLNDWGNPPPVPPDYTYGAIRCQRNLEDFARLWICGMPTLPADYTVQLGWSSVSSGSPRIRLYWASETNGGIGYLTNTTIAAQQIAQHNTPIGEISPTSTLTLPANVFSNGLTKYFLFEAGAVGSGQLTLTISQGGTNTIAQTSAWFDFHDITDCYEQARVTNVLQEWPDMVQTNLTSGFQVLSPAKVNPGDAKQLAFFIHGWRMGAWDWFSFSSTMFKRLYWQGYQGRFAALRWPTRDANTELFPWLGYITYNRSEHIAFKSGSGAAAYLNDLRSRFPDYTISGCSHSMGGIVAMQTLKQLAAAGQQPVDNWVLMQAAVPAQCFDPTAPNFQMFLDGEAVAPTPDVYRDYATGITNALRSGGKIANFFNPDDFALWTWRYNQAFYNANLLGNGVTTIKPNAFIGYSTDGTTSVLRTNVWSTSAWAILYGGYYGPSRAITGPLELMPFVARPRGLAVGASPNVHGQIQGQQLNLATQLGFGAAEGDHSGQFNRNIQEPPIWPFYSQLRTNFFLQP